MIVVVNLVKIAGMTTIKNFYLTSGSGDVYGAPEPSILFPYI